MGRNGVFKVWNAREDDYARREIVYSDIINGNLNHSFSGFFPVDRPGNVRMGQMTS